MKIDGIEQLQKTGEVAPTQLEGYINGKWFYFRYRRGYLRMSLWEQPNFEGKCLFFQDYTPNIDSPGMMDDEISEEYMKRFLREYKEAVSQK